MNDESTPKGAHEIPAKVSNVSLPEPTHASADDTTDDLWSRFYNLPSTEYIDGYGRGWQDGVNHGRQQADDEQRGRGAVSAAIAAQVARMGPADELEERRGRPERAALLRQIMADRGIAG